MSQRWVAACDGSALTNPGPAGWAWCRHQGDPETMEWASGGAGLEGTNNIGELTALKDLLEHTPANQPLEVKLDSMYTLNAASKWRHGWKRKGWRKADGKPILNLELIKEIDALLEGRDVTFTWVKAHQAKGKGDAMNEFVDVKAREAAGTQEVTRAHM